MLEIYILVILLKLTKINENQTIENKIPKFNKTISIPKDKSIYQNNFNCISSNR